jgi:hypothetical protein
MEKKAIDETPAIAVKISEVSESDKGRLWAPAESCKPKTVLIWVHDDGYVTKVRVQIGQKWVRDKHW